MPTKEPNSPPIASPVNLFIIPDGSFEGMETNSISSMVLVSSKSIITSKSFPNIHGSCSRARCFPDACRKVNKKWFSPKSLQFTPLIGHQIFPRFWATNFSASTFPMACGSAAFALAGPPAIHPNTLALRRRQLHALHHPLCCLHLRLILQADRQPHGGGTNVWRRLGASGSRLGSKRRSQRGHKCRMGRGIEDQTLKMDPIRETDEKNAGNRGQNPSRLGDLGAED